MLRLPEPIPVITGSADTNLTTINAESTFIRSNEIYFTDNVLEINVDDIGPGVTKSGLIGGLQINRGGNTPYQIIYDEIDDSFKVGYTNSLEKVAIVDDASKNFIGLMKWNGQKLVGSGITESVISYLANVDQDVDSYADTIFNSVNLRSGILYNNSTPFKIPSNLGSSGNVLATDGSGNLYWTTGSGGGGGGGSNISSGNSSVSVNGLNNTISVNTNGINTVNFSQAETSINNPLVLSSGFKVNTTDTTTNNYIVGNTETVINWNGTANGIIVLPAASGNRGRMLFVQNKSLNQVVLTPSGSDTIGGLTSQILTERYDSMNLISDGQDNWIVM